MNISELCIRRPVMTVLLSTGVVIGGVLAYLKIPVAALPSYNTPVINVSGSLPGASPESMATAVALPLEKQFSTIEGLKMISSSSTLGNTSITLEFNADRNIDAAAVDVQAALLRAQRSLPTEMTQLPSYRKVNPADAPILLLAMTSPAMPLSDLNDYAENVISPTLSILDGVAQVLVFGGKRYAVRVRVNPDLLAARNLSMDDVSSAISSANSISPVGVLTGPMQSLTITTDNSLRRAGDFANLVVGSFNGALVRLRDVAEVVDSVQSIYSANSFNGERAIVLAVQRTPNANTVAVVDAIRRVLPRIQAQLPSSIKLATLNDRSVSIRDSVHDVKLTLLGTVALVVLVILMFVRRLMATLIPSLTLPISLIGALSLLYGLGYSLDNVSLLGITLAVGLVVDDAIVVLENIVRHIENGETRLRAALLGAKEVGFTIVSISLSLVAVFIPIFFMPGVIGLLFHEFAVVVGLSVLVSAVISLTLVPMLSSYFLPDHTPGVEWKEGSIGHFFERGFLLVHRGYERTLDWALAHRRTILLIALATFVLTAWMFQSIPKGFFPEEDIGQISVTTEASEDIAFDELWRLQTRVTQVFQDDAAVQDVASVVSSGFTSQNSGRMFVTLKPIGKRPSVRLVMERLRQKLRQIPGINVYMQPVQNLQLGGRPAKSRFQYTLQSVSAESLYEWSQKLSARMSSDALFRDVTTDAQIKGLQATLKVDRDKASLLGVPYQALRDTLYDAFGDRNISSIFTSSNTYQVILQNQEAFRQYENALEKINVRSRTGKLIPLGTFATIEQTVGPTVVNHQGQLQSVTISFNLAPNAPLGDATKKIDRFTQELRLPPSIITSYGGDAAVFQETQGNQVILIVVALLVIYVLLGVLYESYIHPLTILAGLPSAAVGALLTLNLFHLELTLIATIGILMLIGIVKKNAIMMIDFALEAQRERGMAPAAAIREACLLRLRPILMTTLAALMGALPIALGLGAGAELRQPLGLVVVGGLIFSQVITLYITPVIFLALDRFSGRGPRAIQI